MGKVQLEAFSAKTKRGSRLRQRKYALVGEFGLPENLLYGLRLGYRRCGNRGCHCVNDRGHPQWSLRMSVDGDARVEHVPRAWAASLEKAALETKCYLDAMDELMVINMELVAETRSERQKVRRRRKNRRK